jgi:hypothetical protein
MSSCDDSDEKAQPDRAALACPTANRAIAQRALTTTNEGRPVRGIPRFYWGSSGNGARDEPPSQGEAINKTVFFAPKNTLRFEPTQKKRKVNNHL